MPFTPRFGLAPLLLLLFSFPVSASEVLEGLPDDLSADPSISSPGDYFGFDPADRHLRHDQVVSYLAYLAETSERVSLEHIGWSHGGRPLKLVTISAPERQSTMGQLRADRVRSSRAGDGPLVIWLGYAVHGNEASTVTAAVVTAWYLAAARNEEVMRWLDEAVIVIEPVLNPDGVDRFAHWVNMHRGRHPASDPADREHHEGWPGGRTNYYWFDLNRDWLPLAHPESRARLPHFHAWRPHVLADFHEMGPNSSYFFQPGVPERNNPLTPQRNFELVSEIAAFHADRLDAAEEPYYTRETFDDYYAGKGSTYPDLTGTVGILFEQGSARGHVQDTDYGRRTFGQAVANQVRTSLSTIDGGVARAGELKDYQAEFFQSAPAGAERGRRAGWVFGDGGDPVRGRALASLLLQHDITVLPVVEDIRIDGRDQSVGSAWAVPAVQDQFRLLRSMFEVTTDLSMDTFYDVSTWPLGLSFGLPLESVRRLPETGEPLDRVEPYQPGPPPAESLAWIVPWDQRGAPPLLAALLADGYRVQVLTKPARFATDRSSNEEFVRGSLVIHRGLQPEALPAIGDRLVELAVESTADIAAVSGGLALSGVDLGSPSAPVLEPVRPALLVGEELSANNAGYIWFWFDHYLGQPITHLDWMRLPETDLADYSHLILPDGDYNKLPEQLHAPLVDFVHRGGVLIAARRAAAWVESLPLEWEWREERDEEESQTGETNPDATLAFERRAYGDFRDERARQLIGGSVLEAMLDITHPLAFGYREPSLPVMRRGRQVLTAAANPYSNVAQYSDQVVLSGFMSEENRERLADTPALSVTRHKAGAVVRMADDYLFRGYWQGTERMFANALFFSSIVGTTRLPSDADR